jgi:hypothetical protein
MRHAEESWKAEFIPRVYIFSPGQKKYGYKAQALLPDRKGWAFNTGGNEMF